MTLLEQRLQRLGQWRARRERDASIGAEVALLARQLKSNEKSIGAASDAWMQLAPLDLQKVAAVETMRGGTLTLLVESAAASFKVNQALRDGLENDLKNAVPGMMRARTRVGKFAGSIESR